MKPEKGFTLIELLVVISIIGLLSGIVLTSLKSVRMKARDAKRIADFKNVDLAMKLYFDKYDKYPPSSNQCCSGELHNQSFESMVAILVNEGFLPFVPKDPTSLFYI